MLTEIEPLSRYGMHPVSAVGDESSTRGSADDSNNRYLSQAKS